MILYYWFVVFLFICYDIYLIYTFISSRCGKYPPFIPTTGFAKKTMIQEATTLLEKSKHPLTVIDTGCGIGTLLIPLAEKFPHHSFVGIEWSPFFATWCKARCKNIPNIQIIQKNMFDCSFQKGSIFMCFIVPEMAQKLAVKIKAEAPKSATIITNGYKFPLLSLKKTLSSSGIIFKKEVFIYSNQHSEKIK